MIPMLKRFKVIFAKSYLGPSKAPRGESPRNVAISVLRLAFIQPLY